MQKQFPVQKLISQLTVERLDITVHRCPQSGNDNGTWHFTKDEDEASDWLLHVKGFSPMCPKGELR